MIILLLIQILLAPTHCFWDVGTTTPDPARDDTRIRTSFFRWQMTEWNSKEFWFPYFDWVDLRNRRRLQMIAGISIDLSPLSTAALMNRRILVTAANFLEPVMDRMKDLRIWCLGRAGLFDTPYRYRVFRVLRVLPRSNNPEHQHGPRGSHVPRHDVAVIISLDQIYIWYRRPTHYQYAYPGYLTRANHILASEMLMAGSGYEYLEHIYQNYKIFYSILFKKDVVDCSKYIPKWWGKFICIKNTKGFPGLQNGGALLSGYNTLVGVGCFEIRYNEDKIYVFTDLRYYVYWIHKAAELYPGQYYEYAYPQWSQVLSIIYDGHKNWPYIPAFQKRGDLYPLGRK